jgi:hypothetical protein
VRSECDDRQLGAALPAVLLDVPSGVDKRCFQKAIMLNAAVCPPTTKTPPGAFQTVDNLVRGMRNLVTSYSEKINSEEDAEPPYFSLRKCCPPTPRSSSCLLVASVYIAPATPSMILRLSIIAVGCRLRSTV